MYAVLYKNNELCLFSQPQLMKIINEQILEEYGYFCDTDYEFPWEENQPNILKISIFGKIVMDDIYAFFEQLNNVRCIDGLSNLNVSNCSDFSFLFNDCKNLLDTLYLGDWDFSNGESFDYIFSNCKNLKDIYLSDTFPQLTEDMFFNCNPNLKIHWKDKIYTYQDLIEYSIFEN